MGPIFEGQAVPIPLKTGLIDFPKSNYQSALRNIQKSEHLIYTAAEACSHKYIHVCGVSRVCRKHVLKYGYLQSGVILYAVNKIDIGFLYLT